MSGCQKLDEKSGRWSHHVQLCGLFTAQGTHPKERMGLESSPCSPYQAVYPGERFPSSNIHKGSTVSCSHRTPGAGASPLGVKFGDGYMGIYLVPLLLCIFENFHNKKLKQANEKKSHPVSGCYLN